MTVRENGQYVPMIQRFSFCEANSTLFELCNRQQQQQTIIVYGIFTKWQNPPQRIDQSVQTAPLLMEVYIKNFCTFFLLS